MAGFNWLHYGLIYGQIEFPMSASEGERDSESVHSAYTRVFFAFILGPQKRKTQSSIKY